MQCSNNLAANQYVKNIYEGWFTK